MSRSPHGAPRHTGLAIAGVVAIPFLSVSAAAWLGDAASSTDPREAVASMSALIGGLVMGLLVRRLVMTVDRRVRGAVQLLVSALRRLPGMSLEDRFGLERLRSSERLVPVLVFVPAEVGRRGPPIRLR